ncbi:MAG: hypothetical protein WAQ52_05495 [Terriglobales bacterium]
MTMLSPAPALVVIKLFLFTSPLAIVVVLSIVIGLLMVVLFGYTSNQKAIKIAKNQLKAHLLAVRLFQDQLHVVVGSYGRILRGTGRYLKLAFMPLMYVIIPITLLIVQLDRYLGSTGVQTNASFLVTVRLNTSDALNEVTLDLPPEISMTAPAVHVPGEHEVVWRLAASKEGAYEIKVVATGQSVTKTVHVSSELARISPVRLRGHLWERMLTSAESAVPENSPVESIAINYPERNIEIAGYEMNWIWLFFIFSMIAGFIFKELLGIQV